MAIINKLEKYNGCILADSAGLGKTFTALAVIKYYEEPAHGYADARKQAEIYERVYSAVFLRHGKSLVCGEPVWDIIYGTGDMTEVEFLYRYRKSASMGGDRIPRRPPLWECSCGCLRFRKVNPDGTDAKGKVKMLKDVRPAPLSRIVWTTSQCSEALKNELVVLFFGKSRNIKDLAIYL